MAKSTVHIIKTKSATAVNDIAHLLDEAGAGSALDKSVPTILKDNISWHYPMPSANTTPWQLEGTIVGLKKIGFNDITCVENKTEVTKAYLGERLNLFTGVFNKHNIEVLFNFKEQDMKWVQYKPKAKMLALNKIYGDNIRIPDYFVGKNIVHLPTVKCHIYTTTTGAMKNAFGGLLNFKRHQCHTYIHEVLVDLLAIQKEIHPGVFCVMDGTTAGNGTGPRVLKPVKKDIMLASADQVAIDAVAAKLMGFDPMKIKYMRLAHEQKLGVADPRDIEITGDVDILKENWNFKVGHNFHQFVGWATWFGPTKFLQKSFTRPPLLYVGNFYSFLYHDVIHWPLREQRIFKKWLKNSEWGQLFEEYRKLQ